MKLKIQIIMMILIVCAAVESNSAEIGYHPMAAAPESQFIYIPTKDNNSVTGFYIPMSIDDAFIELDRALDEDSRNRFKNVKEDYIWNYHQGIGTCIGKYWSGKKERPSFRWQLYDMGVTYAEDQDGIILKTYWRYLNGKPINLMNLVEWYKRKREAMNTAPEYICPNGVGPIVVNKWLVGEKSNGDYEYIHIGICPKTKDILAYEYDKGWYAPTQYIIGRINNKKGLIERINPGK